MITGAAYVSLDKLGEVDVPQLKGNRVREEFNTSLVHFEALLKILVLFQERRIIDDNLKAKSFNYQRKPEGNRKEIRT